MCLPFVMIAAMLLCQRMKKRQYCDREIFEVGHGGDNSFELSDQNGFQPIAYRIDRHGEVLKQ